MINTVKIWVMREVVIAEQPLRIVIIVRATLAVQVPIPTALVTLILQRGFMPCVAMIISLKAHLAIAGGNALIAGRVIIPNATVLDTVQKGGRVMSAPMVVTRRRENVTHLQPPQPPHYLPVRILV